MRADRLYELDQQSNHYENTIQRDNFIAVRKWHSLFLPNQLIPDETVLFQNGIIMAESECRPENGAVWQEVSRGYNFNCIPINDN